MSAKTETPGTSTIAAGTRRRAPLVQEGNRTAYHTIHATGALQVLLSVFPRSFCQFWFCHAHCGVYHARLIYHRRRRGNAILSSRRRARERCLRVAAPDEVGVGGAADREDAHGPGVGRDVAAPDPGGRGQDQAGPVGSRAAGTCAAPRAAEGVAAGAGAAAAQSHEAPAADPAAQEAHAAGDAARRAACQRPEPARVQHDAEHVAGAQVNGPGKNTGGRRRGDAGHRRLVGRRAGDPGGPQRGHALRRALGQRPARGAGHAAGRRAAAADVRAAAAQPHDGRAGGGRA